MKHRQSFFVVTLFCLVYLFILATPARAFFGESLIDGIKSFFSNAAEVLSQVLTGDTKSKDIAVDSVIELAQEGDVEKNGEIDSGDTVIFKYTITNPTENELVFITLLTNIPRNKLNFIHDIQGTASLSYKNDTITIPNLRISPQGEVIISFKARVNYSPEIVDVSTEPELIAQNEHPLAKSQKREIKAKAKKDEKLPGMIKVVQK